MVRTTVNECCAVYLEESRFCATHNAERPKSMAIIPNLSGRLTPVSARLYLKHLLGDRSMLLQEAASTWTSKLRYVGCTIATSKGIDFTRSNPGMHDPTYSHPTAVRMSTRNGSA